MSVWVKICGITCAEDAEVALASGADALGLNLVATSKRVVDVPTARSVAELVRDRAELVLVVADRPRAELLELRERTGVAWLQLHGHEAPTELTPLLPHAYKAVRIGNAADIADAARYGGERLLVDAKVGNALGGTGERFDWQLASGLAEQRALIVAGGLTPENVAAAVRALRPFGVDTASGVEAGGPRRKDPNRVAAFVRAARAAALAAGTALGSLGCSQPLEGSTLLTPTQPLPGAVAATFHAQRCSDGAGAPVAPRATRFLLLTLSPADDPEASPPAPITLRLLEQREGYESLLVTRAILEPPAALVFRTLVTPPVAHPALHAEAVLQEVRLPVSLAGTGELALADDWTRERLPGGGSTYVPAHIVLRCELSSSDAALDNTGLVDYEPKHARLARQRGESP